MRNLYISLLFLLGAGQFVAAQTVSTYYFKYKTGVPFEDISSGATTLYGTGTDEVLSNEIPFFPFTFGGTTYNSLKVSDDGIVVLGSTTYHPYFYDNYFLQDDYTNQPKAAYPILIAWGEALTTGETGSIIYKITGTAPNRKMVIQFKMFANEDFGDTQGMTTPPTKNFQVCLSETSNQIQYVYGDVIYDWYNNANIGIAASAVDFLSVNTATNTVSTVQMYMNAYGNNPYTDQPYAKGTLPENGNSYVFAPSAIMDVPTVPVTPVSAIVSMAPQYPVEGQHRNTIYLGYGEQAVTLSVVATGGNPPAVGYTYQWSPASGLSNPTAATPLASPAITTTYEVIVTDSKGGSVKKFITVYVVDPREGSKFKVCKLGKTTICISKEAVDVQLREGALLGDCAVALNPPTVTASNDAQSLRLTAPEAVAIRTVMGVYPNPSVGEFTVRIPGEMQQGTITIFDANGRMVTQKKAGENQQSVTIALQDKKPGVYLIKLSANGKVQTSKLIVK